MKTTASRGKWNRRSHERKSEKSMPMSLHASAVSRQAEMIQKIGKLVSVESPSSNKSAVDRAVSLVAGWCESEQGRIKLHRQSEFGDLLEVSFGPRRASSISPLLLLGHLDTVWEMGTIRRMPFRKQGNRIGGPGVLDMKAGVVMGLTAIQIVRS